MLELRDVSRATAREKFLVRASFACPVDRPTSILGLTASGREAVIALLSGADRPQSGTIRLGGREIGEARRSKGAIVQVGPGGTKPSGRPVGKVIGAAEAGRAGLQSKMNTLVKDLDLDHRIRLGIAMAVAARPQLLLINAPAEGLAGTARERLCGDLGQMLSGIGSVVVLIAGSADEAHGLGGNAAVFDQGAVVQSGAAEDVFAHPASLAAAMATSWPALNVLAMTARDGAGVLSDGSTFQPPEGVRLPDAGACTLAFRPADATLERAGGNCLRFVVRAGGEEDVGGRKYLRIGFAGTRWLAPKPAAAPHQGAVMNVFVDRSRLLVFDSEGKAIA